MAGVGDHHVQLGYVVRGLQILDGAGGIGFIGAVDFGQDQLAVFAFGEVMKRFGPLAFGVAHGSDDGAFWSG